MCILEKKIVGGSALDCGQTPGPSTRSLPAGGGAAGKDAAAAASAAAAAAASAGSVEGALKHSEAVNTTLAHALKAARKKAAALKLDD